MPFLYLANSKRNLCKYTSKFPVIGIHNNNRNNDESIIEDEEKSCGNVDMDSDC